MDNHSVWFTAEIQQMMYGFGDVRKPLLESARLIETIVHQQLTSALQQASEVSIQRGSRLVALEDLLFLMRRDKAKLQRFVKFLKLKDLKGAMNTGQTAFDEVLPDETDSSATYKYSKKRYKTAIEFLSSIDPELCNLGDEEVYDEAKKEREIRADLTSKALTPDKYIEWAAAKRVGFGKKLKGGKFREWLLHDMQMDIKMNPMAVETLYYMAHETVAQIVDMCLLVKRDRDALPWNPLPLATPCGYLNPDYPNVQICQTNSSGISQASPSPSPKQSPPQSPSQNKSKYKKKKIESSCITPSDVREVIRRYWSQSPTPFAPFSRNYNFPIQRRLLSC